MAKTSKPAPSADPARKQAVIYARVSSKEQEKEGFSIPAQLKLLKEYAAANGFMVAQEYVDVETAKQSGRTAFGEMVAYLKGHPAVRVMLVEKTDRLYRNLKDWVTVDELDVEIHFPKEGVVLSRESRSSEKFMHGIKVLMAKNYVDNLSEETRKGMLEKAEQGIWPSFAPLGYRNLDGPDGKKIIAPDPDVAPIISKLFDWYATGRFSLKEAAYKARDAGLVYRKSGAKVPVSTVHSILRNRIYTGWFEWNGKMIQGRHEPLVLVELWERVQAVMDGRFAKKHRRMTHDFAFSGLIACSKCCCSVVGEIKKQRYVYYHCTGYADKCKATPRPADESMCGRRFWSSNSPVYSGGCILMMRFSPGCRKRFAPATPTNAGSKKRPLLGCGPNTTGYSAGSIRCTWTGSMGAWTLPSSTKWRRNGAPSSRDASVKSTGTRKLTSPIWTKAPRFSNLRGMPNSCSSGRNRAKNAVYSTLYYRTALGRTAKSLPPSANHLICWQKRLQSPRGQRSRKSPI